MNEKNLIRPEDLTPSERREIAQKGGKASGEARRRKKDMKQKMKALLELPAAANDREQLEALGVSPDDMDNMDNEMVLVMSMFLSAAQGDTKAFDRVIQILGKDIAHEELALKKRELKLKEKASAEGDSAALSKLDEVLGKIEGGF